MRNGYKPKGEKLVNPEEVLLDIGQSKGYITIIKEQGRITYNATGKSYSFKDPEETIRAQVYLELIEKYKYPANRIDTEVEPPRREPKLPADIVVYEKLRNKCFITVEAKAEETEKKIEEARREGLGNATLLDSQYLLLACGSLRLAYDVYEKPPLEELEKYRIADIPIAYGKEPKFKYKKGDSEWDLKAANFNELQQKFQLCHDEIWEGGKRDPAIAFDEMSKLMFTKIFDERFTKNGEYYRFQIGTHEEQRNVARRIREIYVEVQDKEPNVFKGEIELPDRLVFRLVEILQDLSFSRTDLDVKGRAFEKFLDRVFRGEFGQYFTRREMVEFMVDMLEPTKDDMCLDPACGSGGFLLYTMDRVRKKAEVDYSGDKRAINEIYWYFPIQNIFGIEINDRIARIAMMDMVIHDDGHTNIENNDSLGNPKLFNPKRDIKLGKYTFLLTNPPFGAKVSDEEVLKQYELGSKQKKRKSQRTEILFIERCLDFLRPGGRIGIVLPDGVLSNSSLQYVRDFIERKAKILAVISLPQTAFVPVGAGVKASLLFLQKKRFDGEEIGNYPIFMSIAEHIGYDATSRPDKNELPEILTEYKELLQGKRKFNPAFVVEKEQLEGRLDPYYHQPSFESIKGAIKASKYEVKTLGELSKKIMSGPFGSTLRSSAYTTQGIPFIRVKNVKNGDIDTSELVYISLEDHNRLKNTQLKANDIVLSKIGTVGNAAMIPESLGECNISENNIGIILKDKVNKRYVLTFLNSYYGQIQIQCSANPQVQSKLNVSDVERLKIPLPPREIQDEIANIMDEAYKERREKLTKAKKLLDSIEPYLLEQLGIRVPQVKEGRSFVMKLKNVRNGRLDPFYHQHKLSGGKEQRPGKFPLQKLEQIGQISDEKALLVPDRVYDYVEIGDIDHEWGQIASFRTGKTEELPKVGKTALKKGDILVSTVRPYLKGICQVDLDDNNLIGTAAFAVIRAKQGTDQDYLFALMRTNLIINQLVHRMTGSTYPTVSKDDVKEILIPVPPLEVQSQIAEEIKRRRKEAEQLRSQAEKVVKEAKEKAERMILGNKA